MIDLRSWPKKWNDASLRQVAMLPEHSRFGNWSLLGVFVVGLAAGYAVANGSRIRAIAARTLYLGGAQSPDGDLEVAIKNSVTPSRSNHSRRVVSEVK